MRLFSNIRLNSLEDLLVLELEDLYDGEKRVCDLLPKMAEAATAPGLRRAFLDHLQQTKGQLARLEQMFADLGRQPSGETCDAMKGLIKESEDIISATGNPHVKDAALISAAQRIEHYEISGYGTARSYAEHLGRTSISRLLPATLDEEAETDQQLTHLAELSINVKAEYSHIGETI